MAADGGGMRVADGVWSFHVPRQTLTTGFRLGEQPALREPAQFIAVSGVSSQEEALEVMARWFERHDPRTKELARLIREREAIEELERKMRPELRLTLPKTVRPELHPTPPKAPTPVERHRKPKPTPSPSTSPRDELRKLADGEPHAWSSPARTFLISQGYVEPVFQPAGFVEGGGWQGERWLGDRITAAGRAYLEGDV